MVGRGGRGLYRSNRGPGSVVIDRDPGLQPERATLSWRRAMLSAAVTMLTLIRAGIVFDFPVIVVASALSFTAFAGAAQVRVIDPSPGVRILLAATSVTATGILALLLTAAVLF